MTIRRDLLLRRIATILSQQPGISYQHLAELVGVSRRTLYRIAPTRHALMQVLQAEAVAASDRAVAAAGLADTPPLTALARLTEAFVADLGLYAFWVADTWTSGEGPMGPSRSDAYLADYRRTMTAFFERGQQAGLFRQDLPAGWLIQIYDALLGAAGEAGRSGTLPPEDLVRMVLTSFLDGALVSGTDRSSAGS